jgi:predicted P-loop ATPase/GTPase
MRGGFLVLVVGISGLIPHDAGKTWFTIGLVEALRRFGLNIAVYKPVAAHNLWFSPRTLVKSIELKLLVGNDILAYYERGVVRDIAKSNPVALGLAPRDLTSSLDEYLESFEDTLKMLVILRFTECSSGVIKHFVIRENLENTPPLVKSSIENLAKTLSSSESSIEEVVNYLRSEDLTRNLNICLNELSNNVDLVLVESFNDAVIPYTNLLDKLNMLIVVTPGRVLFYNESDKLKNAITNTSTSLGEEGYRARYLVKQVKPTRIFSIELQIEPGVTETHLELARIINSFVKS